MPATPRRTCAGHCQSAPHGSPGIFGGGVKDGPWTGTGRTGPRDPAAVRWQARSREEGSWCEDTAGKLAVRITYRAIRAAMSQARLMIAIDLQATPQVPAIDLPQPRCASQAQAKPNDHTGASDSA